MGRIDELLETVMLVPKEQTTIDAVLTAHGEITVEATIDDLPKLLAALRSDRADFWIRELLSEPIARIGGPAVLPQLLDAFQRGFDDGHDNDGFSQHLVDLVESNPEASASELRQVLAGDDTRLHEAATWLLGFAEPRLP